MLLEGKKRIAGNLCVGSGGFQACDGSKSRLNADGSAKQAFVSSVTKKWARQRRKADRATDNERARVKLGFAPDAAVKRTAARRQLAADRLALFMRNLRLPNSTVEIGSFRKLDRMDRRVRRTESLADASRSMLAEAEKRLAGNLCVKTGAGSGGGFTACGGVRPGSIRSGNDDDLPMGDRRNRLRDAYDKLVGVIRNQSKPPEVLAKVRTREDQLGRSLWGAEAKAEIERRRIPPLADLRQHLQRGGRIQITTHMRSTVYDRRHADLFRQNKAGDLFVVQGKNTNRLTQQNGVPLVGFRLLSESPEARAAWRMLQEARRAKKKACSG